MERYSRQILAIGVDIQEKIQRSRVAVIGIGALGSRVSEILTRMGVKRLRFVDPDIVEISNLHRVSLFDESDIGMPKVIAATKHLEKINSEVTFEPIVDTVDNISWRELLKGIDVIIDGLDNDLSRSFLNYASVHLGIPYIYGAVTGEYGNAMLILPGKTPCLACFMKVSSTNNACEVIGVSPPIVETIAALEVQLFLNLLRGIEESELLYVDLSNMSLDKIKIKRNDKCSVCSLGKEPSINGNPCGVERVKQYDGELTFSNEYINVYNSEKGVYLVYKDKIFLKKRVS
ncbi:thiamine biosynthesis protein ThiF [Sulfolobales archaeon HS-7]|nr:thiamine biosynthesis protein ThiF [Sulfolobales archaeon HS-7]